jgi:hypothetical protein
MYAIYVIVITPYNIKFNSVYYINLMYDYNRTIRSKYTVLYSYYFLPFIQDREYFFFFFFNLLYLLENNNLPYYLSLLFLESKTTQAAIQFI